MDAKTPATVYAVDFSKGVFRSTDGGDHWQQAKTGTFVSVATDPKTPATVYAVDLSGNVFRSIDAGVTWRKGATSITAVIAGFPSLVVSQTTPGTVYAGTDGSGVFCSTDAGDHWKQVTTGDFASAFVLCLAVDPVTPAKLYAGTTSGILQSTDAGATWQQTIDGLVPQINAVIVNPQTPATMYTGGTVSGVFRSTDAGATWQPVTTGLTEAFVSSLMIDPLTPATIYAGTDGGGVFRSTDAGDHWKQVTTGLAQKSVYSLAVNPLTPATIYAGTGGGVFRSTDAGDHWKQVTTGLTEAFVSSLMIDPLTPATIYAGTDGGGVFRSTDAGDHWKQVTTGDFASASVLCLAVDPVTPAKLYAGTTSGILQSTDAGDHWKQVTTGLTEAFVSSLMIDPLTPATIYAGTDDGDVFRSMDACGTWENLTGDLSHTYVVSLAIAPGNSTTVFAGTGSGLRRYDSVWTLATTVTPAESGSIKRSPDQSSFIAGTAVTLTAMPVEGWRFAGWTGAAADAIDPLKTVVTMDADKVVVATFEKVVAIPPVVTLSSPANGTVVNTSAVDLSWQPSSGATSYTIALDTSSSFSNPVNWKTETTSQTTVTLAAGVTYYWRVAAVNAGGVSPWSPVSSFSTRNPPVTLTLTLQLGNTTMHLSTSDGNGSTVPLDAAPTLGAGNRTLVPVRAVAEAMGGSVDWDAATRTATVTVGNNTLELTLEKNTALFNGIATPIDTDPKVLPLIINGRTMLPLRFVVESFGATVTYDASTKTITITYTKT
jgi:photosystem II stability/assembly factor-like uncharacterized protein